MYRRQHSARSSGHLASLCAVFIAFAVSAPSVVGGTAVATAARPWGRRSRRATGSAAAAAAVTAGGPIVPRDILPDRSNPPIAVLAGRRSKRQKEAPAPKQPVVKVDDEDGEGELSLDEMRARLGPVGKTVAGAVEVGIVTGGSYLSGGLLGYVGGGLFGIGSLLRPSDAPPPGGLDVGAPVRPPSRGIGGEFRGRMGNLNSRAVTSAKSWAQLSAAFSGFHALTRVVRGGKEDRWNGIVGSAMTGAYLNRQGGPQSMLQGATTYASFTYVLDIFFAPKTGGKNRAFIDDQFDFSEKQLN